MYYFGYGSNMNHEQMKIRCPNAKFIKKVFLKNYKFVYDGYSKSRKGAVGNIVKSNGQIVWGGLFEIDEICRKRLDKYEGYPIAYDRKYFDLIDDNGNEFTSIVYLREPKHLGKPTSEYREIIKKGAVDCNLPEEYVEKYL